MTERKLDRRFSRDRNLERIRKQNNVTEGVTGPPPMYRPDLLRAGRLGRIWERNAKTGYNEQRKFGLGYEIEFRKLAEQTKLSVGTIRQALDGNASKLDSLWILAKFFNIPWLQLFDVEKRFEFDEKGIPSIAKPAKKRKLKKGEVDLG